MVLPTTQEDLPSPLFLCVCVSFVARFGVLYCGGGPLVLLSALLYVFPVLCPFTCFGCCFLCYSFSLFAFSPLSLLFPFPFFCFVSLSLLPLLVLFLCLILLFPLLLSWPFLRLLCFLFFLRLFFSSLFPSFPSSSSSFFSFPFWFLLLLSHLAPLSQLSLPFLLLLPFFLFLLRPLPSFLFLFRLRFFPSFLLFPSCWLFFLLVCPRCLFGGFLFAFLAFGLRFFSVFAFGFLWCFSVFRVLVCSVPEFCFHACISVFSPHLSSATSRAFASDSSVFFSALPYLTSSVPLLSVSSSSWFLPVASAACLSLRLRLLLPWLRSFLCPSAFLSSARGGV